MTLIRSACTSVNALIFVTIIRWHDIYTSLYYLCLLYGILPIENKEYNIYRSEIFEFFGNNSH